jgi:hypothetical protein
VRDHLVTLGVKREDARSYHQPIYYCRVQSLVDLAKYLKSQGWRRVLIICKPENSRGFAWHGRRILGDEGIKVAVGYAPDDFNELTDEWWKTHWKVQRFVGEAINTSLDFFYPECR